MIKKHKNLFIYLAMSIVFIIVVAVSCVQAYYNPSEEEFLDVSASSLLRKKISFRRNSLVNT